MQCQICTKISRQQFEVLSRLRKDDWSLGGGEGGEGGGGEGGGGGS